MEERNEINTEDIVENFDQTEEILQKLMEEHLADEEDEVEVTTEEVEGLALNIVELNEMYSEVERIQKKLIQDLDELQVKLNNLETVEEE